MLRYKLTGENITPDERRRYNDTPTNNAAVVRILRYSFTLYARRVATIRESRGLKAHAIKEAVAVIVRRKGQLKNALSSVSIDGAILRERDNGEKKKMESRPDLKQEEKREDGRIYHKAKQEKLRAFLLMIDRGISEREAVKLMFPKDRETAFFISAIADANADINHLNELRKDLGAIFGYYDGLNISYSPDAKITNWDITEAVTTYETDEDGEIKTGEDGQPVIKHKGRLTPNAADVLYFYLMAFRKKGGKTATLDDLRNGKTLLSFLLDEKDLNEIVEKCAEESAMTEAQEQAFRRAEGVREQILNKWL